MKISVVIPTRNRPDLLRDTLNALKWQSLRDFQVVVVCDGEDKTRRELEYYSAGFGLNWICLSDNRGCGAARNAGAQVATGDLLAFLDDDTVPAPHWLASHLACHKANYNIGEVVVVGKLVLSYAYEASNNTERFFRRGREASQQAFEAELTSFAVEGSAPYFGVNCSILRSAFMASGGFDVQLRYIDEEMELGNRLQSSGIRFVHQPHAVVCHRDTKDLTQYHTSCWKISAKADLRRVLKKAERNQQTSRLVRMYQRGRLRREKEMLAWNHPHAVRRISQLAHDVAEVTDSAMLFRMWCRLANSVEYWDTVKEAGHTLESLCQLAGSPLRILTFHSVSEPESGRERRYYVSPTRFRALVKRLRSDRYEFVTPLQWLTSPGSRPSIALTFDDGYDDFFTEVFPVIHEVGISPTVFIVVDQLGKRNEWDIRDGLRARSLLTLDRMREMHRYGVQFGSHSLTHPWLPILSNAALRREVQDSKARLENLLGSEVTSFAYPGGGVDVRVRSEVARAGYRVGLTCRTGLNQWGDPLLMNRIEINQLGPLWQALLKIRTGSSFYQDLRSRSRKLLATAFGVFPRPISARFTRILSGFAGRQISPSRPESRID